MIKYVCLLCLCILTACGQASVSGGPIIEKERIVVESLLSQIEIKSVGSCAEGVLQQRFLRGGNGFVTDQEERFSYIFRGAVLADGTYKFIVQQYIDDVKMGSDETIAGNYKLDSLNASIEFEGLGKGFVEGVGGRSKIVLSLGLNTPWGQTLSGKSLTLTSFWSTTDQFSQTPLCP